MSIPYDRELFVSMPLHRWQLLLGWMSALADQYGGVAATQDLGDRVMHAIEVAGAKDE
jgi:hypothetical protein